MSGKRKATKRRKTALNLEDVCRIQIPSSLFTAVLPDIHGTIMRFFINQPRKAITSWMCHAQTHLPLADCIKVLERLSAIGMIKREYTPSGKIACAIRIYSLCPFVELSVDDKTKKRKRHAPTVDSITAINAWLSHSTGPVKIQSP